jgi:hypothetical protein
LTYKDFYVSKTYTGAGVGKLSVSWLGSFFTLWYVYHSWYAKTLCTACGLNKI